MNIAEPFDYLISQLVKLGTDCANPACVAPLLQPLAFAGLPFDLGAAPGPSAYTRNLIYRDERFELVLIRWGAGSRSPIHDHAGQRCQMLVLDGTLRTDDYALIDGGHEPGAARIGFMQSTRASCGDLDIRSSERDLHLVAPDAPGATSLHLYTRPIDTCLVFDPAANTCRRLRNHYDWTARTKANQAWLV